MTVRSFQIRQFNSLPLLNCRCRRGLTGRLFLTAAMAAAAVVVRPPAAWADQAEVRGHAKLYLSSYQVNTATAAAAGVPRSFSDEAADLRLIFRQQAEPVTAELHLQFDTLSTRFEPAGSARADARVLTASQPGLPDDRLRLFDLTFDPDNGRDGDSSLTSALHIDRLSFSAGEPGAGTTIGRQTISWGDGMVFSVLDLVSPFTPTAIDREYKPGDDGVVTKLSLDEQSDLEAYGVVRRDIDDRRAALDSSVFAAKLRRRFSAGEHSYSFEAIGAERNGDPLAGFGGTADFAGFVLRLNSATTWVKDRTAYSSMIANLDRGFVVDEINCYAFIEYYRNGLGQDDPEERLAFKPLVDGLRRGELFVSGSDYLAPGLRAELTARSQLQAGAIVNLRDGSSLLQPQYQFLYSEGLEFTLQGSWPLGGLGTEFGGRSFESSGALSGESAAGLEGVIRPPKALTLLLSAYF